MDFEFLVKQPFTFNGTAYQVGDVITGDTYQKVSEDPHYSSPSFVIRRNSTVSIFPKP